MDIILKEKLKNSIGINTGNNIIHFLFKKDIYIPCDIKYNYIIESLYKKDHLLEFYFGDNLTTKNNYLFYKIVLPVNILLSINCKIISNYIIINISSKIESYNKIIFKLYNLNIKYLDIDKENIQKFKLHYELYDCIKNIKFKLKFMNLNNCVKINIMNKIDNLYKNKDNYENLQIMKKINELKNKFII
jgi:hypothetical protein